MLLVVFSLLRLSAHSQNSRGRDSTTLPNAQLRTALKLIEDGKDCKKVLVFTERQNTLLEKQVDLKDSIIQNKLELLGLKTMIIETYKMELSASDFENTAYKRQVRDLDKALKRSNTRNALTKLGAGVGFGILLYLLIIK